MKADINISKLEVALIFGIIGCLLLATWEFGNLMVTEWVEDWVGQDKFTNKRIILYGIAFLLSVSSLAIAIKTINIESRFMYALNRALLWYGSILLISTIAIFVFDCLPEIAAGIIGAAVFAYTIYILQKKFFSEERILSIRKENGQCPSCGSNISGKNNFCNNCGTGVQKECSSCQENNLVYAKFCEFCGVVFK